LHDALPILSRSLRVCQGKVCVCDNWSMRAGEQRSREGDITLEFTLAISQACMFQIFTKNLLFRSQGKVCVCDNWSMRAGEQRSREGDITLEFTLAISQACMFQIFTKNLLFILQSTFFQIC